MRAAGERTEVAGMTAIECGLPPENTASSLASGLREHLTEAQCQRLASARVGIAGAGGLGSNVAMLLVRSGIRRLMVVDGDRVEASNLNRQLYMPEDLGRTKVEALGRRLLGLEPELEYEGRAEWLDAHGACAVFSACGIVVEALDSAALKAQLCTALLSSGFFVVGASGVAGWGLPPLSVRNLGKNFVCVGDGESSVGRDMPVLAPRVMQAAALQADAVLSRILGE